MFISLANIARLNILSDLVFNVLKNLATFKTLELSSPTWLATSPIFINNLWAASDSPNTGFSINLASVTVVALSNPNIKSLNNIASKLVLNCALPRLTARWASLFITSSVISSLPSFSPWAFAASNILTLLPGSLTMLYNPAPRLSNA